MAAKNEKVEFVVPVSVANRIRKTHGLDPSEVARDAIMNFYQDHRRKSIPVKRMGIGWHPDVYKALLKNLNKGSVSKYVREVIFRELSKSETDLVSYTGGREMPHKDNKLRRRSLKDRNSIVVPLLVPEQWYERLDEKYPGKVSTWIKSVVQLDLESRIGKELPVLRGMHAFMNR